MAKPYLLKSTFRGRLGDVIGAEWRGVEYWRTYTEPKQPNTPAQLLHKQNFKRLIIIANNLCKTWFPYVFEDVKGKTLSNQFMSLNKGIYQTDGLTYTIQMPYNATGDSNTTESVKFYENGATLTRTLTPGSYEGNPIGFLWAHINVEKCQIAYDIGRGTTFEQKAVFPESWNGDLVYRFVQLVTDEHIYQYATSRPARYKGEGWITV